AAVRRLERVKVFSRTAEKVARFCETMRAKLSLDVVPAASADDCVKGSDIVVTITTSATPVFSGESLQPGTHVNAAGSNSLLRQEIDEATLRKMQPHRGGLAAERPQGGGGSAAGARKGGPA